ncbi:YqgE/AlgH family protein [Sphingobium sp. JS3065]|uniref:YqgE/AlgH family protein n=1 Tax=Sphingobium sp. JS3065 TaxID=2970925 RepID=UPI0022655161|nr:YqgE/AlgH family protein [Sphingobium sp. JS3065]UZW56327.1 YqgE/AlgH family protein [Sphingobium sp. JS3065]
MTTARSYAGQFLLALPGMEDMRFDHSVIAMCVHDENGGLGIAVSDEIDGVTLHDLLESFDIDPGDVPDMPVLSGGPVEPRRGFVLHSLDWMGHDMVVVGEGWGLSGSLEILKAIAEGRGPSRYLVALGYAGWGAGQLDEEMSGESWFPTDCTADLLFDIPAARKWSAAYAAAGIDAAHLVSGAGSA